MFDVGAWKLLPPRQRLRAVWGCSFSLPLLRGAGYLRGTALTVPPYQALPLSEAITFRFPHGDWMAEIWR